jgi:hypothetical protein
MQTRVNVDIPQAGGEVPGVRELKGRNDQIQSLACAVRLNSHRRDRKEVTPDDDRGAAPPLARG